jgi:MFS transporter, ACS family, D-galactonate transporter
MPKPVLILLVFSVAMLFIDRGSLSIAAPVLSVDLGLSPAQMGVLLSSFFWTYASFGILSGWLVDRYNVNWVLGLAYFVWSVATLVTGFASNLHTLILLRLMLGVGESASYPAYSRIIEQNFPAGRRGLPNALIDAGGKIGPALGLLVGGLLVERYGWRTLFFALGSGSLLWLIPWSLWAPRSERARVSTTVKDVSEGPTLLEILKKRDAWGTFVGNFCCNYAYYFLMTWLPTYLVTERHLSMGMMGVLSSIPFWGSAASSVLAGWASDRWIARGATPTRVRKTFVVTGLAMASLVLPVGLVPNLAVSIALLIVTYLAFGLFSSNHWAITQTLAGPGAAGKWTGLQNCCANLGGVIAPYLTGLILSRTGSYFLAFFSSSIIVLIGAACYLFVVGKVQAVRWERAMEVVGRS